MASTTQTTNYGLPIYQQSDKASWVDTNEPFSAIDTALKGAVTLGESLSPVVAQNTSNIATLQTDLTAVTSDVNTIKNTTLPAMQNEIDGAETAAGTSYNNTDSGLSATNVQNAIDEIAKDALTEKVLASVTSNGVMTNAEMVHTLYDSLSKIPDNQLYRCYIKDNQGLTTTPNFRYFTFSYHDTTLYSFILGMASGNNPNYSSTSTIIVNDTVEKCHDNRVHMNITGTSSPGTAPQVWYQIMDNDISIAGNRRLELVMH